MAGNQIRLWLGERPPILASGSRTRADLLASVGIDADCIRPAVDERSLEKQSEDLNPIELACFLAKAKVNEVAKKHPRRITIAADQVLEIDGEVLHKPVNLAKASDQLNRLQGRTHALHSAVAIVGEGVQDVFHESAYLTMRPLSREAIAAYLSLAGEARVTSSVGAYQLEGLGAHLFERIDGDHSTVLGLPLIRLLAKFRTMGVLAIA